MLNLTVFVFLVGELMVVTPARYKTCSISRAVCRIQIIQSTIEVRTDRVVLKSLHVVRFVLYITCHVDGTLHSKTPIYWAS